MNFKTDVSFCALEIGFLFRINGPRSTFDIKKFYNIDNEKAICRLSDDTLDNILMVKLNASFLDEAIDKMALFED